MRNVSGGLQRTFLNLTVLNIWMHYRRCENNLRQGFSHMGFQATAIQTGMAIEPLRDWSQRT
jgi:hypothetical protein